MDNGYDLKTLLKNVSISYGSSAFGFLILLLLAQEAGVVGYAVIVIGLSIGGLLLPMLSMGGERVFVRDAVTNASHSPIEELIIYSYGARLSALFVVVATSFIAASYFNIGASAVLTTAIYAIWFAMTGINPTGWYDYIGKTKNQNLIVLSERIITFLAIVITILLAKESANMLLVGIVLLIIRTTSVIAQVTYWTSKYSTTAISFKPSIPTLKTQGIDVRIAFATILNGVLTYGTQLILAKSADSVEISAYGLAFQLMNLCFLFQGQGLRLVSRSIANSMLAKHMHLQSISKSALLLSGGSAVLAAIAYGLGKVLPYFFTGEHFTYVQDYTSILSIWVVIAGLSLAVTQHNIAMDKSNFFMYASFFGACVAGTLGTILIPIHGATGAAWVLLTTHTTLLAIHTFRFFVLVKRSTQSLGD